MYNKCYHSWCIRFQDLEPPAKKYLNDDDATHYIVFKLQIVFEKINGKRVNNTTQIETENILCTYNDDELDESIFTCYFDA